jgi:hypothetical protein
MHKSSVSFENFQILGTKTYKIFFFIAARVDGICNPIFYLHHHQHKYLR